MTLPLKNFKSFVLTNTLGTFLEYLDATLYAFFATIIAFNFFPEKDPTTSLLLTLGVFAISFIARPFGALLFGYLGDRFGRRNILAANILMMALATMMIGLIPSYAFWGLAAPLSLILCRIVQGLAISSEYTGSSIYLLETILKKHGLFSGISTAAGSFGIFFASLLAMGFSHFHIENYWRCAFVFSGFIIGLLAFYLRRNQPESAAFLQAIQARLIHEKPAHVLFEKYKKELFSGILISMYLGVALCTILVYSATYLMRLGMSNQDALIISTLLALTEACCAPLFGYLADQYGLRPVLLIAALAMAIVAFPLFCFITHYGFWIVLGSFGILSIIVAAFDGPLAAYLVNKFDVSVRHSGVSLSYNIGAAVFGGMIPVTLTYLIDKTNLPIFPSFLLIGFALLAVFVLWREKIRRST